MNIDYKKDHSVITMQFDGELDEYAASATRQTMESVLFTNNFKTLILDLKKLTFMDSTGIGVILGRYKQLKNKNINCYVMNVSPAVDKIFRISGLYELFPLLD